MTADSDRALVERLLALEAKATPAPWPLPTVVLMLPKWKVGAVQYRANKELIAEVRNALPALLALAERGLDERADVVAYICRESPYVLTKLVAAIERGAHVGAAKERTP